MIKLKDEKLLMQVEAAITYNIVVRYWKTKFRNK